MSIAAPRKPKSRQVSIRRVPINSIMPSPENGLLYNANRADDPAMQALAESIHQHGIREPLVVTADHYIVSGHRRHFAASLVGLATVPVRVLRLRRAGNEQQFLRLLREHNQQRIKTRDELLREAVADVDRDAAYHNLVTHRLRQCDDPIGVETFAIEGCKRRAEITAAKQPMLNAITTILDANRKFWPLTVRQVHYRLLNNPPLKHTSKPDSVYRNDRASYQALCELAARARLASIIPWKAIVDETRPVTLWATHPNVQSYLKRKLAGLFRDYWRDLVQSQPHHVEIVGEKNTLSGTIRPIAEKYCLPVTLGRGYCSLEPRHAMAERFRTSGKAKLIVLLLTDHDPEGEDIAMSFARSMRDDFDVWNLHPVRVALTTEQVEEFKLPPVMQAKQSSSRYAKFAQKHGDVVHELEALPPEQLQGLLDDAVRGVLDLDAYDVEQEAEHEDAVWLAAQRKIVLDALGHRSAAGEGAD